MFLEDLNDVIRQTISKLIKLGHSRGQIAKILLGSNGPVALSEFLRDEDPRVFGLRPLMRIGEIFKYDLKIVFVKEDNNELNEEIELANLNFANDMATQLTTYLDKHSGIESNEGTHVTPKRKDQLMDLLDDL